LKALVELGAEMEAITDAEQTPLHMIAQAAQVEALNALVELGTDIEAIMDGSWSNAAAYGGTRGAGGGDSAAGSSAEG
jgi:hypothetical protein